MQLPVPVTLMTVLLSALATTLAPVADSVADPARPWAGLPAACQPLSFEQAQAHYDAGHYAQAYTAFAALADCGHAEAARIALQMRHFGPALYGRAFMAGPIQLQRWRRHAAAEPRTDTPPLPPTH